jgi:heptosyltransferase-1
VWREIGEFRRRLAAQRYDAVVDSQGLFKSALITRAASGTRHGMDRTSAREPIAASFYDVTHTVPWTLHAVERNRCLTAAALGYSLDEPLQYGLHAQAAASGKLPASYAVLLTMTSRAPKLWPEARWIELGRSLALPVVLPWGSAEERSRAERIGRGIEHAVIPQRMAIEALAAVLVKAKSVVGLDSGLTHLAAALGVPTVAVFCGSDPALNGVFGAPRAKNVGANGRPPQAFEVLAGLQ